MNYSTWIILLASINVITIFSGFPMGTKKVLIIITTLCLLMVGFIFRAIEKRQRKRILEKKQAMTRAYDSGIDAVAKEVARDVHEQVVQEIDQLNHYDESSRN